MCEWPRTLTGKTNTTPTCPNNIFDGAEHSDSKAHGPGCQIPSLGAFGAGMHLLRHARAVWVVC